MFSSLLADRIVATLSLALPLAIGTASPADPPPGRDAPAALPERIDVAPLGQPTFAEDFRTLDWGVDQVKPARPHRWRTVHGYGGPASVGNRSLSRTTLAVDPDFAGQGGTRPLGLQPFATTRDGLTITARRADPAQKAALFGRTWTSGLLTTKFSFAQLRGYFEAEMDLPVCQKGAWPAFWLLPRNLGWPRHGEIDVPETVGTGKLFWTAHTLRNGKHDGAQVVTPGACERGWHRYGVLWRADRIGFYYDRRLVGQVATPDDYTEPMFLLLNLTVGGAWPGEPPATTDSITMRVRSVRAWKAG
ncbi:MAG: glycoside hydrolase family 16 protein [Sphingomonas adhaesiva]|uniref:glycoside hydrolase family 16 protein n=1 Tax=Sphingomonas adhaesiva TaxID=28212 RepID=UPI002FFCA040